MTEFFYFDLAQTEEATGCVVVIDVLRAFTTAAFAFRQGAKRIFPVDSVQAALALRRQIPDALVMGEVDGVRPEGFDHGNSPAEISNQDLKGRTLIQRTSAGTQGLVRAKNATKLFAASFVVAWTTAQHLLALAPDRVSFIITGSYKGRDGEEDRACGAYIEALMRGQDPSFDPYRERVYQSTVGQAFQKHDLRYFGRDDLTLSLQVNLLPFSLVVRHESGRLVMTSQI